MSAQQSSRPLPPPIQLARDIAQSDLVADYSLVGIGQPPEQTIHVSKPLKPMLRTLFSFSAPHGWEYLAAVLPGANRSGRLTVLVSRSGGVTTWPPSQYAPNHMSPAHIVVDALLRAFSAPTAPPTTTPALLDEIVWLDRLLTQAAVSVTDAVALAAKTSPTTSEPTTWHQMRLAASERAGEPCAAIYEWMDEGMFSRWVIGLWPEPTETLAALADLLPAATLARVRHRCRQLAAHLGEPLTAFGTVAG